MKSTKLIFLLLVLLTCRVLGNDRSDCPVSSADVQQLLDKCAIISDGIRFNNTLKSIDESLSGGISTISFETRANSQVVDISNVLYQDNTDYPLYITTDDNGNAVISTSADIIKVTSGVSLFYGLRNLTNVDISRLDFSEVTGLRYTFQNCSSLKSIDLNSINMSKCSGLFHTFEGCESLEQVIIDGSDLSSVRTLEGTFKGCKSLKTVKIINTDTPKLMRTDSMFANCLSLEEVDLSGLDMDVVKWSFSMFMNCPQLKVVDFGDLNMSSIEWLSEMFYGCESLSYLNLSGINTEKVSSIERLFYGAFKNGGTLKLGKQFIINDYILNASLFENCGPLEFVGALTDESASLLRNKYDEDTRFDYAANDPSFNIDSFFEVLARESNHIIGNSDKALDKLLTLLFDNYYRSSESRYLALPKHIKVYRYNRDILPILKQGGRSALDRDNVDSTIDYTPNVNMGKEIVYLDFDEVRILEKYINSQNYYPALDRKGKVKKYIDVEDVSPFGEFHGYSFYPIPCVKIMYVGNDGVFFPDTEVDRNVYWEDIFLSSNGQIEVLGSVIQ